VPERPYVLLSCAISVDGCLDAPGPSRLVLSSSQDLDRVDGERAAADAIMVGAGTIRRDDPGLLVRSPALRAARETRGLCPHPVRVTLTASGELDAGARFFAPGPEEAGESGPGTHRPGEPSPGEPGLAQAGPGQAAADHRPAAQCGPDRYVYCPARVAPRLASRLAGLALVTGLPEPLRLDTVLSDLAARGISRLMVEGGANLGMEFLTGGLVDELHLVIAPFFVGDPVAPRFAPPARYPNGPHRPMTLAEIRRLGDVVLLRYLFSGGGGA
jgi:5-amino-6-(5-phosphoribosylamino)uracil reductase